MHELLWLFEWSDRSLSDQAVLTYSEMKLGGCAAIEWFAQRLIQLLLKEDQYGVSTQPPVLTWVPTFVDESGIGFVTSKVSYLSGYAMIKARKIGFTYHYQATDHETRRATISPSLFAIEAPIDVPMTTVVVLDDAMVTGAFMNAMLQEIGRYHPRQVVPCVLARLSLSDPGLEFEFDLALYRRLGTAGVIRIVTHKNYRAPGFLLTLLDAIPDNDAEDIIFHLSPNNILHLLGMLSRFVPQSQLDIGRLTRLFRSRIVKKK